MQMDPSTGASGLLHYYMCFVFQVSCLFSRSYFKYAPLFSNLNLCLYSHAQHIQKWWTESAPHLLSWILKTSTQTCPSFLLKVFPCSLSGFLRTFLFHSFLPWWFPQHLLFTDTFYQLLNIFIYFPPLKKKTNPFLTLCPTLLASAASSSKAMEPTWLEEWKKFPTSWVCDAGSWEVGDEVGAWCLINID